MVQPDLIRYKKNIYLQPGDLFISTEPTIISTILGSCVSVIFYDPITRNSAICHAQLPVNIQSNELCSSSCPNPCNTATSNQNEFRFLSCALKYMVNSFRRRGIETNKVTAKIYGGSSLHGMKVFKIGERNISTARKLIKDYGLKLISEDVGENFSRKILLYSDTGHVELNKLAMVDKFDI